MENNKNEEGKEEKKMKQEKDLVIGQHCYKDKGLFLLSFLSCSIFIVVALEAGYGVWSMMWQTTRIRGKRWTRRS